MVTRGRSYKGSRNYNGMWMGFEGKFYMEETAQWLVRNTPRMQLRAKKFASIYVGEAIKEAKRRKGLVNLSDKFINELEDLVTLWIQESSSVSTKRIIHKLQRAILGEDNVR